MELSYVLCYSYGYGNGYGNRYRTLEIRHNISRIGLRSLKPVKNCSEIPKRACTRLTVGARVTKQLCDGYLSPPRNDYRPCPPLTLSIFIVGLNGKSPPPHTHTSFLATPPSSGLSSRLFVPSCAGVF